MAHTFEEGARATAASCFNAYIQNIRNALMRNGHGEQEAHALAVGAVKRWASGKGKVHPEVRAAARAALAEWNRLKATHH